MVDINVEFILIFDYSRTVTYTADPKEGFKAEVVREPTDIVVKVPTQPPPTKQAYKQQAQPQYAPSQHHQQQQQPQQYRQQARPEYSQYEQ